MYCSDIGQIDFRWGTERKGAKFKHGYGFAHIIAKRTAENNDGEAVAYKMVEVIAKATEGSRQSNDQVSQDDARIKLYYDGYTAVLVKSNDDRKWLLTGWENEETATNASGEVRDSSSATAVTPIRTRRNGDVTVSNNSIIQQSDDNINTSTQKNQSRSDADYLSAVERGDMETAQRMVDEAAKAAGYTIKAYHGTENDFTVFEHGHNRKNYPVGKNMGEGHYFSANKSQAEIYANGKKYNPRIKAVYNPGDYEYNIHDGIDNITELFIKGLEVYKDDKRAETVLQKYSSIYGTLFQKYEPKSNRYVELSRTSDTDRGADRQESSGAGVSGGAEQTGNVKFQFRSDADYLSAVERGDMQTARRRDRRQGRGEVAGA